MNYYQISFKDRKSLEKMRFFTTKLQMINFLYFPRIASSFPKLMFKCRIVRIVHDCESNLWNKRAKRVFARKRRRKKLDAPEGRRCLKCDYGRMKKRKKKRKEGEEISQALGT